MTTELRGTRRKEMEMNVTGTTTGVASRRAAERDRSTLLVTTGGSDVGADRTPASRSGAIGHRNSGARNAWRQPRVIYLAVPAPL